MSDLIFDIETGSLTREEIESFIPEFEAPSNYKDQEKIQAYINNKKEEWLGKAALSPLTGKILAISFLRNSEPEILVNKSEEEMIQEFWPIIARTISSSGYIIGFNSNAFDLPFLVRRSWKLGIKFLRINKGRYLRDEFVDLMDLWKCGNRDQTISLNNMAKFLGVGEKTDDGKNFQSLLASDPEAAIAYAKNDVVLINKCAKKIGVI